MKTTVSKMLIIFILLSSALNIGAAPAGQHQWVKTPFTGVEVFAGMLDPGQQYVKDGRFIIEGMVEVTNDSMSDPRLCGVETITINANLDAATGIGPMWGTTHIATTTNGAWNTVWAGKLTGGGHAILYQWGWGQGGYKGLTFSLQGIRLYPYTPDSDYEVTGYIMEYR
jgi:hypothetical protein